jgi:hypothetical protein
MNVILIASFNTKIYQKTILGARVLGPLLKLQYEQFKSDCTVSLLVHNLDNYYIVGRDFLFPLDTVPYSVLLVLVSQLLPTLDRLQNCDCQDAASALERMIIFLRKISLHNNHNGVDP